MGLEKVIEQVQADAREAERRRLAEARKEAERIAAEAQEKAAKNHAKTVKRTQELVEAMRKKELSLLRLELKKKELLSRQELADQALEWAREKIRELGKDRRKKALERLVKRGLQEMPDARFFVCAKEDQETLKSLASKLKPGGQKALLGGVVLQNMSQDISLDLSFDSLLKKEMEEQWLEAYRILFG